MMRELQALKEQLARQSGGVELNADTPETLQDDNQNN